MSEAVHNLLDRTCPDALFVAGDFPLDDNVVAAFPEGTKILSANRFGTSAWTVTARLHVELPDGSQTRFFPEVRSRRLLMEEEFHKTMPGFVPKPHSWEKYRVGNPDIYFFLSQYIDMSNRVLSPHTRSSYRLLHFNLLIIQFATCYSIPRYSSDLL